MAKWYMPWQRDEEIVLRYMLDHADLDGGVECCSYVFDLVGIEHVDPDPALGLTAFDEHGLMQLRVKMLPLVIERLVSDGLIERPVIAGDAVKYGLVRITAKGRAYFVSRRRERVRWFLNSLIVPTIVALLTTLITIFLSGVQWQGQ